MVPNSTLPDEDERQSGPLDDRGASRLTPHESAQLDQIEAGLRGTPTIQTPKAREDQNHNKKGSASSVARAATSANPAGLALRVTGFGKKHKKGLIGGGIGAGVLALMIAGFLALIPLKAAHMLKIITEKRFAKMENAVSARAEKRVINYMQYRLGGADFTSGNASLIVSSNMAKDLYRNWQTAKFENNLDKKYGLTFQRDGTNGANAARYTVLHNGSPIASADGTSTLTAIGNNEFRSVIDDSVKQETHFWQISKRRHLRGAMYERWRVSKWYLFPKTREKVKESKLVLKKRFQQALIDRVVTPISDKYAKYFSCIIDDGCDLNGKPSELDPDKEKNATKKDAQKQLKESKSKAASATGDIQDKVSKATEKALENQTEQETKSIADSVLLGRIQKFLQQEIVQTVIKWAGAGLGFLELISKLDHAIQPGGAIDKIIADRNTEQFGQYFAVVASSIDQLKAGDLTSGEAGLLLARMNGMEQSRVYRKQYAGGTGQDNTTYCGGTTTTVNGKVTNHGGYLLPQDQLVCPDKKVKSDGGILAVIRDTPVYSLIHTVASAFDNSVGIAIGIFNDLTSAVFSSLGLDDLTSAITDGIFSAVKSVTGFDTKEAIAGALNDVMNTFFGPTVTGLETGADFFNAADAGGDLAGNQFAKQAGGVLLTAAQLLNYQNEENQKIANQSNGLRGYYYKIADIGNARSIASRLVAWAPLSGGDAVRKTSAAFASFLNPTTWPSKLAFAGQVLLPGSHQAFAATDTTDPYGIDQWGFDLNDVRNKPLTDPDSDQCKEEIASVSSGSASTDYNPSKTSLCMLDKIAIESLNSMYTTNDDGGLNAEVGTSSSNNNATSISASRAEMNNRIQAFIQSGQLTIQNNAAKNDISSGIVQDGTVSLLLTLLEQGKFNLSLGALKSDHKKCSSSGNISDHYWGLAIDIGNTSKSSMSEVFTWLYNNRATLNISDLIHDPRPANTYNIDNGKVPGNFDAGTLADHRDHIHVSVKGPKSNPSTATKVDNCK